MPWRLGIVCCLAAGLLAGSAGLCAAGPGETGRPLLTPYTPDDYGGHSQNWAIAQDDRGILYFGNGTGVLRFDGATWQMLPVTNTSIVRSLAVDAAGTVWVGAVGELGYLRSDATGVLSYVSLRSELAAEDAEINDVWRTFATEEGIFFWTYDKLLRFKDGIFRSWPTDSHRVPCLADGKLFHNQRGEGLTVFDGDGFRPLPGGEALADVEIVMMLPLGEGAYLTGSRDGRLRTLALSPEGVRLEPFPTEAADYLARHKLYAGALLPRGGVALATITGGAVAIDRRGALLHRLTRAQGLPDDSVWALYLDREEGLWLALNRGLARVEAGSPWTAFEEIDGLEGTVEAVARHRGSLHAATSLGVYRLGAGGVEKHSDGDAPYWSLLAYEAEDGGASLLAGSLTGVFASRGEEPPRRVLTRRNAFELHASARRPGTVYVGHMNGVAVLRRAGGEWIDEGDLPGVDKEVRDVAEDAQGHLWLGTHFDGVLRLTLSPPLPGELADLRRFGPDDGLPSGRSVKVLPLGEELLFGTPHGLFVLDPETGSFAPSDRLGDFSASDSQGILRLAADADANVWMSLYAGELAAALRRPNGAYELAPYLLKRIAGRSIYAVLPEPDGVVWFGGVGGLFRFDSTRARAPSPADGSEPPGRTPFPALIRRVSVAQPGGAVLYSGGRVPAWTPPVLPYAERSLRFDYALPAFDAGGANLYRSRLVGLEGSWSAWTGETYRDFTALWEGRYRFEVQGRDIHYRTSEVASFAFRVLPPWYRSWWAYGLYALALGASAWSVHRWQLRRARLEMEVERLAEANALMRQTERERQRFVRDLEAKNAEMERFIYTVSHDLKSPLISIRGFLGMLERDIAQGQRERIRHDVERIQVATAKMGALVEELLALSKIGRVANEPEEVSLVELAREAVDQLGGLITERGVEVAIDPGLPRASGDRQRLLAMLQNLVENAVKYMGEQPRPRVEIGHRRRDGETVFFVRDNGAGIDPRFHGKVFGLFERLSPEIDGTGIGLALVQRIVEVHGGRIWVESAGEGRGSTFCFTLTREPAAEPAGGAGKV